MFETDMQTLRDKMAQKGMKQEDLARSIGMDPSTLSRKLQTNGKKFTVGEAHKVADALCLSAEEARLIFLK